jgi:TIR domain-containing protein
VRVFVSHAGRDRAWAEWAAWQLERAGWGITVELDAWEWRAGEDFVARMNTAHGTCDHMLALFSAADFEPARWTGERWTAAVHVAKARPGFLVPVRLDDTPAPPLLARLMAPALHGLPRQQAREVLLAALRPAAVRQTSHPSWLKC